MKIGKMGSTKTPTVNMESDSSSFPSGGRFRVSVVQASTVFYDTIKTLQKAETLLIQAASEGAKLVVFPEAFVGGYPHGSYFGVSTENQIPKESKDFRKYHDSAINVPGPEVDQLAEMAGRCNVHLVMGVIEKDGDTLYSTVLFFDSSGYYLGKHRNIMPAPLERITWGYGDGSTIPVFDTPIGKIGAAISMENRMPLLRTAMYATGIEIFCAPTAARTCCLPPDGAWRDMWKEYMTHTALEGGCFVLSASQYCRRRDNPFPPKHVISGIEDLKPVYNGGSVIISPSGVVLAEAKYGGEEVLSAILDRGEIALAKLDFDVVGRHARPDVLSLTVRDHPVSSASSASAEDHTRQENED